MEKELDVLPPTLYHIISMASIPPESPWVPMRGGVNVERRTLNCGCTLELVLTDDHPCENFYPFRFRHPTSPPHALRCAVSPSINALYHSTVCIKTKTRLPRLPECSETEHAGGGGRAVEGESASGCASSGRVPEDVS